MEISNENRNICAKCGGTCCKKVPGIAFPEDIGDTEEDIVRVLKTGKWSIDWEYDYYEWDPLAIGEDIKRIYYLRPRIKRRKMIHKATWSSKGECVFFKKDYGCRLEFEDRPRQCRDLEPKESMDCKGKKDKSWYVESWNRYQRVLLRIVKEGELKFVLDGAEQK